MSLKENIFFTIKKIFKNPLSYILAFSILFQNFIYSRFTSYSMSGDSLSYLAEYYKENIFLGQVNHNRTPIYPYFCKIIELFSNENNFYSNITFVQGTLFVISIIFFYLMLKKLFKSKPLYITLTLLYALNPFLYLWNTLILTEGITIFELVLLLYFTVSYIKEPKKSSAIGTSILLFIMVMTRPANIYLVACYLVFWLLNYFIHKKDKVINIIKTGLISLGVCILGILIYCTQMKFQHGTFGLTAVSDINTTISVVYSNTYKYGDNKKIIEDIDKIFINGDANSAWDVNDYLGEHYSLKEINSFMSSAKKNGMLHYIKYHIKKVYTCGTYNLGIIYSQANLINEYGIVSGIASNVYPLTFALVYLLLLGSFIFLIVNLIKRKEIEWIVAALFSIIAGNIILSLFCAPFEWQRLSLISIPCSMILIPYLLREIFILSNEKPKKKKKTTKKKTTKSSKNNNSLMSNIEELFEYAFKFDIDKLFRSATDNTIIQFFRYLFVGGIAAVVNIGMLYVFTDIININYIISNVLSFILGLFVNYLLSKKFVFQGETNISKTKEFVIYAIIGVLGLGIDTLLVWLFTDICGFYYMISKLISTLLVFIWNFGARKVLYKIIK